MELALCDSTSNNPPALSLRAAPSLLDRPCPDWTAMPTAGPLTNPSLPAPSPLSFGPTQFYPVIRSRGDLGARADDSVDSLAATVVGVKSGRQFDLTLQAFDSAGLIAGGVCLLFGHC